MTNQSVLSLWENKMFSVITMEQKAPWKSNYRTNSTLSVLAATNKLKPQMAYIIQITVKLFQNQSLREKSMILILKRIDVTFCCKCWEIIQLVSCWRNRIGMKILFISDSFLVTHSPVIIHLSLFSFTLYLYYLPSLIFAFFASSCLCSLCMYVGLNIQK